ncbi:MAG: metalloregulator ArsR/SmtB family transcription factor [Myxococcota bacterium]
MAALQTTTDLMRLLSDPTRIRLMHLLAHDEMTVAELTGVTQLGQSRVSTHLGKLREAGLVRDRRVGTSCFYGLDAHGWTSQASALWKATIESTRDDVLEQDRLRAEKVIEARAAGLSWADAVAGQMERHYSPGRTWEATTRGLVGLCRLGRVLDIASGDGSLAALIAPRAERVTCLDVSPKVVAAGRKRLAHLSNVELTVGDMQRLPFAENTFDAVMMMNCLTYAEDPTRALHEAARVLVAGGTLTGVTLRRHQSERAVAGYGHVNLGFAVDELGEMLTAAGFDVERCEVTSREQRKPYFQIITFYASNHCVPRRHDDRRHHNVQRNRES